MTLLQQVKEELAKEYGYTSYIDAASKNFGGYYDGFMSSVAIRYSNENILLAAKNATASIHYGGCNYEGEKEAYANVDVDSILKYGDFPNGHHSLMFTK